MSCGSKVTSAIVSTLASFLLFRFWPDLALRCVAWFLAGYRRSRSLSNTFWPFCHFWRFLLSAAGSTIVSTSASLSLLCRLLGFLRQQCSLFVWFGSSSKINMFLLFFFFQLFFCLPCLALPFCVCSCYASLHFSVSTI